MEPSTKTEGKKSVDQSAAFGSGTENDVDGGNLILFSNEETSQKEHVGRMISFKRIPGDIKEELLVTCLTASDVGHLNRLVIASNDAVTCIRFFGHATGPHIFEDENGKLWNIYCSYIRPNVVLTKGWSSYVREKRLRAGDIVFFQQHRSDSNSRRTDSPRLFIGFRRRGDGDAGLQGRDYVLPDPTSLAASSVHQGRSSALRQRDYVFPDPTSPASSCVQSRSSALGQRNSVFLDVTSANTQLTDDGYLPESWNHVLTDAASPVTSSEAPELREKSKEALPQLGLPEHSITRLDPILVVSCGDSQDSEETFFISYIINELCLRGFSPLRYDLTRSTVTGNQEMLYTSRVGIIIISMNYASSRECTDGFLAVMDHLKGKNVMLIPVFFKVSLSDVENQSGSFGRTLLQLGNSLQASQVQKWMEAIIRSTSMNGCQYMYMKGHEVRLSKSIVRDVCLLLRLSSETNGIKLALERILPLLDCSQSSSPHIVGLWGMAGIGKTTIAREILVNQAERYDMCYFLPDLHLLCQIKGLGHLRDEFFSKIFGEEFFLIDACDTKLSFLRNRLLKKRVLIVLDGVSNAGDVEVLVGGFGWLSDGHTIILTSRNRQVLVQCKVKVLYHIPTLSLNESLRVFGQSQTENSQKGRRSLVSELVKYASGIPLALRVLGSFVENKCISDEKKQMRRLRKNPPVEIQDAFRRSFDVLDDNEKNTFLDLACFFEGENKDRVVNILDGCGFLTDLGICGLIDESLISIVDNRIQMPNIFQDTGRFVVCQENVEAGKRSRLWDSNHIADVLIKNSGTEAIEGIFFDVSGLTFDLSPNIFERMYRLRLLKFYCPTSENDCKVCLPQGLHSLPDELRLLHWERYPLGSLPRNFNPKNLVELNMPNNNMKKLWKGTKNLEKLKKIILSHSKQLTRFPRLSKAGNLEHIDLEGCTSLVKVNSSILHHQKLTFLSLKDCSQLQIMPTTVHLESLEVLNLSGCSGLENLEDLSPNLKELYLARTAIREMPLSLGLLTRLDTLDLENCKRLQHLPLGISNLKALVTLNLRGCLNLRSHPTLDALLVSCNRRQHLPWGIRDKKAAVTHRAKRPASSMDISTVEDMSPPYRRYQLKKVIEEVIMILRKRKREKSVSAATNLSEVQLDPASTSVKDLAYTSLLRFQSLPERPGQPECQYYMKTGECKDGNVCRFHHPKDRESHVSESTSSMASVTPNWNPPRLSYPRRSYLSSWDSSNKNPRTRKKASSKLSETSHVNPQGLLPSLGTSSFVSDITQTNVTRDTTDPKQEEETMSDIYYRNMGPDWLLR